MKYLIIVIFILACSPQKRLNRLIDKHPELSTLDTIRDTVMVIVPKTITDTFISLDSLRDTVIITKDRLTIKTVIKDNKIYIEGECDTDTIYQPFETIVEKVIYKTPTWWEANRAWIIPLLVFLVGFAVLKKLRIL